MKTERSYISSLTYKTKSAKMMVLYGPFNGGGDELQVEESDTTYETHF